MGDLCGEMSHGESDLYTCLQIRSGLRDLWGEWNGNNVPGGNIEDVRSKNRRYEVVIHRTQEEKSSLNGLVSC